MSICSKYEFYVQAERKTNHKWLLNKLMRLDYHMNEIITWNANLDEADSVKSYFVGYACTVRKVNINK